MIYSFTINPKVLYSFCHRHGIVVHQKYRPYDQQNNMVFVQDYRRCVKGQVLKIRLFIHASSVMSTTTRESLLFKQHNYSSAYSNEIILLQHYNIMQNLTVKRKLHPWFQNLCKILIEKIIKIRKFYVLFIITHRKHVWNEKMKQIW